VRAPAELDVFARFCLALQLEQGRPLVLEPFQRLMLADYFAGCRETLILLPKKNGKTTLLAALALYHLITTPNAECVLGATSRDQATILYDQAVAFIRRSEALQQRVESKRGYREIRSRVDSGRIRVLAADVDTADGVIPTLALVDEMHRARSAELYGVFRDGLGPRAGRMLTISAAGAHETTPLGRMRVAARELEAKRNGRHLYARSKSGSYAMHEWALLDDDDEHDMSVVKLANPASWQTLELLAERHDSPSTLPWQWQRFACGLWVSGEAWWIAADDWHECSSSDELADGDAIALGFDGARTGDATALIACRLEDGLVQPLAVFEPDGSDDWQVDGGAVDAALARAFERFNVQRGYFDPPLWQTELDTWSREYGELAVVRYSTSRSRMMQAVERFRTDVVAHRLKHVADDVLTRHVLACQTREVRAGYWLTKSSATALDAKIDAAVAAVLAYEARADALSSNERVRKPGKLHAF
jgi:phage terminase large subunit-like protein